MALTKKFLEDQLKAFEQELEVAKAHVHRVDGAIQVTKHMLADFDTPEVKPEEESVPTVVDGN